MTQMVPIDQARALAPTKMQQRIAEGRALNPNFAEGVRDAFPVLSIRGKVFRIRAEGTEQAYIDPVSKLPVPFLDVVLVNGSRTLAKSYYKSGFTEGDNNPPDCWSLDSVRPDPSVADKINPTCADCKFNAFGSRITDSGKAAKACSDARRICVTLPHNLAEAEPRTNMLRVPQSSLKNLKAYVELLARNGYEPTGCVTRLSFDYNEAFPKLQFNFVGPVTNDEFEVIEKLSQSPATAAMLSAPDFDNAASHQAPNAQAPVNEMQRQAPPQTSGSAFGGAPTEPVHGKTTTQRQAPQTQPVTQPVQQQAAAAQQEVEVRTSTEGLVELPNGEGWLDPATGELVEVQLPQEEEQTQVQEIDPDVVPMRDGRFFNKKTGAFVEHQYRDVGPAPVKGKAKPAATGTKPARGKSTKQAAGAPAGNGDAAQVAAASPKLEQLLGELVPPRK